MIEFKPIRLEDREFLQLYYERNRVEGSDCVFGNSYMWRKAYQIKWCIIEDTLIIRANREGNNFYLPPIGGTDEKILFSVIENLNNDSLLKGERPEYRGISNYMKEIMEKLFPDLFAWEIDRDSFDYTYLTENLMKLSGRAYHGKKNHVNQFRRQYLDYDYQAICDQNIQESIEYAIEWCRQRGCDSDPSLALERDAIIDCLEHFKELKFKGAIIKIDGKVQALTYGEILNNDTAIIHVEKANSEIRGLYAVINQDFATHAWSEMTYINREEDMGEPGLRKAKESYKPVKMIEKHIAVYK